jgi:hypothetical protein
MTPYDSLSVAPCLHLLHYPASFTLCVKVIALDCHFHFISSFFFRRLSRDFFLHSHDTEYADLCALYLRCIYDRVSMFRSHKDYYVRPHSRVISA